MEPTGVVKGSVRRPAQAIGHIANSKGRRCRPWQDNVSQGRARRPSDGCKAKTLPFLQEEDAVRDGWPTRPIRPPSSEARDRATPTGLKSSGKRARETLRRAPKRMYKALCEAVHLCTSATQAPPPREDDWNAICERASNKGMPHNVRARAAHS